MYCRTRVWSSVTELGLSGAPAASVGTGNGSSSASTTSRACAHQRLIIQNTQMPETGDAVQASPLHAVWGLCCRGSGYSSASSTPQACALQAEGKMHSAAVLSLLEVWA